MQLRNAFKTRSKHGQYGDQVSSNESMIASSFRALSLRPRLRVHTYHFDSCHLGIYITMADQIECED
jgi:hypothetical protein